MGISLKRLGAIVFVAATGLGSGVGILISADPSKALLALSGVALMSGVIATVMLLLIAWVIVDEHVHVGWFCGKPRGKSALVHHEAALIGRVRQRHHPIRWWTVFSVNRFAIGLFWFGETERHTFDDPAAIPAPPATETEVR